MTVEVTWSGANVEAVSDALDPIQHGHLVTFLPRGQKVQRLVLLAHGTMYDLPIGCRLLRSDDGNVRCDATGCGEAIGWVEEMRVHTSTLRIWRKLCAPITEQ